MVEGLIFTFTDKKGNFDYPFFFFGHLSTLLVHPFNKQENACVPKIIKDVHFNGKCELESV